MSTPPIKICLAIEGGIIQGAYASQTNIAPVEIELRDFDCDGVDESSLVRDAMTESGEPLDAHVRSDILLNPGESY